MAASIKLGRQCLHLTGQLASPRPTNRCIYAVKQISSAPNPQQTPIEYCVDLVKNSDYESYLCTLLYPKEFRGSAFAIRALYTELALVQDVTSDHMRAMMRLQFWKETLDQIYKSQPPMSPVALQVTKAVHKHNLSKSWFTRILEARAQQITHDSYKSLKEVEEMGERTASSLYYLLLEAGGIKDVNADHACSHLGKCQCLVTLLRAIPYHANRKKVYMPLELLMKHKVSQEQILRAARETSRELTGKGDEQICDLVYEIACTAKQHLATAHSLQKKAQKNTKVIMLNTVTLDSYLTRLESVEFNVFHPGLQWKDKRLSWKLLRKRLFL